MRSLLLTTFSHDCNHGSFGLFFLVEYLIGIFKHNTNRPLDAATCSPISFDQYQQA
jgi:hypothetical protein